MGVHVWVYPGVHECFRYFGAVWSETHSPCFPRWDAFLEMVRDFEILTELPEKEFLKKVRAAYLLPRCFCVTLCVLDSRSVRSKFDIGIIRMG